MDYFAPFFLLLISLFYARLNSISREDFFFTKYIIIKNKTLAEILISGSILIKKVRFKKMSTEKEYPFVALFFMLYQ